MQRQARDMAILLIAHLPVVDHARCRYGARSNFNFQIGNISYIIEVVYRQIEVRCMAPQLLLNLKKCIWDLPQGSIRGLSVIVPEY